MPGSPVEIEHDPGVLSACRIVEPNEIRFWLTELFRQKTPIDLMSSLSPHRQAGSTLTEPPSDGVILSLAAPVHGWIADRGQAQWTALASHQGVNVQFPVAAHHAVLMQQTMLHLPVPKELFRLQRRDGFRIALHPQDQVSVLLRDDRHQHWRGRVLNISAVGVAVEVDSQQHCPEKHFAIQDRFAHSLLEFGQKVAIPCDLEVRQSSIHPNRAGWAQLGLAFLHLSPEAQRSIQLAVMDFERKRRLENVIPTCS
jgi:c-di-GMP-binding flagellar brake protein YcgR